MKDKPIIKSGLLFILVLIVIFFPIFDNKSVEPSNLNSQRLNEDTSFNQLSDFEINSQQSVASLCPQTGVIDVAVIFMTFTKDSFEVPTSDHSPQEIETRYMNPIEDYWAKTTSNAIDLEVKYSESGGSADAQWFYIDPILLQPSGLNIAPGVLELLDQALTSSKTTLFPSGFSNYEMIFIWLHSTDPLPTLYTDRTCFSPQFTAPNDELIQPMLSIAPEGPKDDVDFPNELFWSNGAYSIARNFGLELTHGVELRSRYELMANGTATGLSVYSREEGGWFDPNHQLLIATGVDSSNTIKLMPRHLDTVASDEYRSIKIERSGQYTGTYYYIEVIKRADEDTGPTADINDQLNEGVLIYTVNLSNVLNPLQDNDSSSNGAPVLTTGGKLDILYSTTLGRNLLTEVSQDIGTTDDITLTITITNTITGGGYSVEAIYTMPTSQVTGTPDLMISPWGVGTAEWFETQDIWVDNDENGWGQYAFTDLYLTADYPEIGAINKIIVNVTNIGEGDATNVKVQFYDNKLSVSNAGFNDLDINITNIDLAPGDSLNVSWPWDLTDRQTVLGNMAGFSADPNTGIMDIEGSYACLYARVLPDDNEQPGNLWNNGGDSAEYNNGIDFDDRKQENVHFLFDPSAISNPNPLGFDGRNSIGKVLGPPLEYEEYLSTLGTSIENLSSTLGIDFDALTMMLSPRKVTFDIVNPFQKTIDVILTFDNPYNQWFIVDQNTSDISVIHTLTIGQNKSITVEMIPVPLNAEMGTPLVSHLTAHYLETFSLPRPSPHVSLKIAEISGNEIAITALGGITIESRLLYHTGIQLQNTISADGNQLTIEGSLFLRTIPTNGLTLQDLLPTSITGGRIIKLYILDDAEQVIATVFTDIGLTGQFTKTYSYQGTGPPKVYAVYAGSDLLAPAKSQITGIGTTSTSPTISTNGTPWNLLTTIYAVLIISSGYYHKRRRKNPSLE